MPPVDGFNRPIDYLRVSVTDRCNLRCSYCMPEEGVEKLPHDGILTFEEILRVVRGAAQMGMGKVRVTGGEPLVRQGVPELCRQIVATPGIESVSMTTNGVLLADFAQALHEAGVGRLNISLDTLRPERFLAITRRDLFHRVWTGIELALSLGFHPVKLNAVVMAGVNDDEIEDLARLTLTLPLHVRFIEYMPFQPETFSERFVSASEILARVARVAPVEPVPTRHSFGPARLFTFPGAPGRVGVISPVSEHFCPACNRLRLTADGKLRSCLFAADETDLRTLLRNGATDDQVAAALRSAVARKPERHSITQTLFRKCISRPMSRIGG